MTQIRGLANATRQGYTSDMVVDMVAKTARRLGVTTAHGDQAEAFSLPSAFAARSIRYVPHHWSQSKKEAAVSRVRRWFSDGVICIENSERMKTETLNFEERISGSGISFQGRARSHDDYVSLLLMIALVEIEEGEKMSNGQRMPGLPGSPVFASRNEAARIRNAHRMWSIGSHLDGKVDAKDAGYFDWKTGEIHADAAALRFAIQARAVEGLSEQEKQDRLANRCVGAEAAAWNKECAFASEGHELSALEIDRLRRR